MNSKLTEAIKEAFATSPSNVAHLDTLEIFHDDIEDTIYIVKDMKDHLLTLETEEQVTFEGVPFNMSLPASNEEGIQELNIAIDNVDRRISDFINTVKDSSSPVLIKYRPYLSSDPTTPQLPVPLVLELKGVTITAFEVRGTASFANMVNKPFPSQDYTRKLFPTLGD